MSIEIIRAWELPTGVSAQDGSGPPTVIADLGPQTGWQAPAPHTAYPQPSPFYRPPTPNRPRPEPAPALPAPRSSRQWLQTVVLAAAAVIVALTPAAAWAAVSTHSLAAAFGAA
jgi:hypothetical protein